MKDLFPWTIKAILLPLLPFWSGALIRYLCLGEFSWRIFGVGELAISMAVLFLLLSTSAGQINDQQTRASVSTLCYYIAAIFFIIFVAGSFIETIDASHHESVLAQMLEELKANKPIDPSFYQDTNESVYLGILDRIRVAILIALGGTLPTAYVLRYKYKLEA